MQKPIELFKIECFHDGEIVKLFYLTYENGKYKFSRDNMLFVDYKAEKDNLNEILKEIPEKVVGFEDYRFNYYNCIIQKKITVLLEVYARGKSAKK